MVSFLTLSTSSIFWEDDFEGKLPKRQMVTWLLVAAMCILDAATHIVYAVAFITLKYAFFYACLTGNSYS